jgi:cytochrome c biogenesis factor
VAVPAVSSRPSGDVYVTLLSAGRHGSVTVRVARNVMVGWVWAGGALMALSGFTGLLLGRRRRRQHRPPIDAPAHVPQVVR